jgi:aspartyl protease family protein
MDPNNKPSPRKNNPINNSNITVNEVVGSNSTIKGAGNGSTKNGNIIPLRHRGGVHEIDVKINGLPLSVIFDSGASDLSISIAEAMVMIKQGTIKNSDILGKVQHSNAQGQISEGTKINIRELIIGSFTLENIEASVVNNLEAPLLLGQSVLRRFKSYEIDNAKNILILK